LVGQPLDPRTAARTVAVMLTTTPLDELESRVGTVLGASDYVTITQATVDAFADVTGDRRWIHADPYLTLALAPRLLEQVLPLDAFAGGVNYGLDRLRFVSALPVGEQVCLRVKLDAVERFPGGATLRLTLRFESPALDKPVCVAEGLYRVDGR
jgi:acyl dehydratase